MIKILLASITSIFLLVSGCSWSVISTPSHVSSPRTFEQKKIAVTEYLRLFKNIDNDLSKELKAIDFPGISASAEGLLKLNNAFGLALDVLWVTQRRLDNVILTDIEEVKAHFRDYKKAVQHNIRIIQGI